MTHALAYARVSTGVQAERETIEQQVSRLNAYAIQQSITLVDVLRDDGVSGADEARAVELVKQCQLHADIVDLLIVTALDRLARGLYLQLWIEKELLKLDIKIVSLRPGEDQLNGSDPMTKAFRQIIGVFAELEKSLITARLKAGRLHQFQKGRKPGGQLPYGYRFAHEQGQSHPSVVVDAPTAHVVKRIFELASFHLTKQSRDGKPICTWLATQFNDSGSQRQGQRYRQNPARLIPWDNERIRLILLNPFYAGYMKHRGIIAKGTHEPLVDHAAWLKVAQAVAKGRKIRKKAADLIPDLPR